MRTLLVLASLCSLQYTACANYIGNPHRRPVEERIVPGLGHPVRVEPEGWWTGLQHNEVELLVHYTDVSRMQVDLGKPKGVHLLKVEKGDSPNYLFVTLRIDANAPEQVVLLTFREGNRLATVDFPVRARSRTPKAQGLTPADVVYLIMPDRFANGDPVNDRVAGMLEGPNRDSLTGRHGGDLKGIIDHLDYLQDLGVTALWLNPELENDQDEASYHGYAMTDLYRIDRRLGTNELYRELVSLCHARNMKVVRDAVFNHIGNNHYWMRDLPTNDWINQWPVFTRTTYRAPTLVDPYRSEADLKHFNDGWFDTRMPDLNQRNPHVARYLLQQAIWWVEYAGLDDFRIDTYTYSDQGFMSWWCAEMRREYPGLNMVGEIWEHGVVVQGFFADDQPIQRAGFDSNLPGVIDFQLMFAIQEALTKPQGWTEGVGKLYYTLVKDYFYQDPFKNLIMLDNHDFDRFFSIIGEDISKYKSGMALLLTTRGIPQIYYATEILGTGWASPSHGNIRKDFPGGWSGDPLNKFIRADRTALENEAFDFTRTLLQYRKRNPVLHRGRLMQFVPEDGLYVYFRYDAQKTVMVLINTSDQPATVPTARFAERLNGFSSAVDVVTGRPVQRLDVLEVPAYAPAVLELKR
jgi:glycosidase